jgi:hypothetical protein
MEGLKMRKKEARTQIFKWAERKEKENERLRYDLKHSPLNLNEILTLAGVFLNALR